MKNLIQLIIILITITGFSQNIIEHDSINRTYVIQNTENVKLTGNDNYSVTGYSYQYEIKKDSTLINPFTKDTLKLKTIFVASRKAFNKALIQRMSEQEKESLTVITDNYIWKKKTGSEIHCIPSKQIQLANK